MDNLTPQQRSKNMAAIKSKGTKIEQLFLSGLVEAGLDSFDFHASDLPGKPDAVHREAKIAVFLDGCFWHGCPNHFNAPATNPKYWKRKITKNRKRDRRVKRDLEDSGWLVRRIWGHSVKKDRARRWWLTRLQTLVKKRTQS